MSKRNIMLITMGAAVLLAVVYAVITAVQIDRDDDFYFIFVAFSIANIGMTLCEGYLFAGKKMRLQGTPLMNKIFFLMPGVLSSVTVALLFIVMRYISGYFLVYVRDIMLVAQFIVTFVASMLAKKNYDERIERETKAAENAENIDTNTGKEIDL